MSGSGGVGELLAEFGDWAAGEGVDVDLFVVEAALDSRASWDGGLTRWDGADIEGLLVEWFPRKVTLPPSEWPLVVATLHHWVDFLAATRGAGRDELHAVIDRVAPEFVVGMGDERRFGPAKFWVARMIGHGVDTEDEGAVRAFLAAVRAGEVDYDQDVLAEIMERHAGGGGAVYLPEPQEPESLPPVVVPPEGQVAVLAEATGVVVGLRVLVAWVGAGRAVTSTKRLRVADARELAGLLGVDGAYVEGARSSADLPGVSLLVAWAKAARLVRVVKGRIVPIKSAAGSLERPVELWRRAFEAFARMGPAVCPPASRFELPSPVGYALSDVVLDLWLGLYPAGGVPVPVELLAASVRETLSGGLFGELWEWTWRRDLDAVLAALVTSGAVELTTSSDPWELERIAELSGDGQPDPTLARLTPLGVWGVREVLRAQGFDAPSVQDLAAGTVERACESARDCAAEGAEAVMAAWVGARGAEEAAAELADFCANGSSPAARLIAWSGLEHTGAAGVAQARRLRSAGGVAGGMAAEWLVARGELAPEAAEEREMSSALAENLAAVHDDGLLVEELTRYSLDDQLGLVRGIADADHPDRVALLTAIADEHPERDIATAARDALRGGRPVSPGSRRRR